jgi:hypothetical protein
MKTNCFLTDIPNQQPQFRLYLTRVGSAILITVMVFCFISKTRAQQQHEGIFLTADDFSSMKISYPHSTLDKKCKITLNETFNTANIKVNIGDSVTTLVKDSIFGYRDKRGTCYRFYNNVPYRILNPNEKILLYSKTILSGVPKNPHNVTTYYFSVNHESPIWPLSIWNLDLAFKDDIVFHLLLNSYFSKNDELVSYDSLNSKYLLNRVYEESQKSLVTLNN